MSLRKTAVITCDGDGCNASVTAIEETRPGHGIPADWLSPNNRLSSGRWVAGSRQHQRVDATELELTLRLRCHDCGFMAFERWDKHRARLDKDGGILIPESDPLPWALDRLDREPCEPLGVQALFDLVGA